MMITGHRSRLLSVAIVVLGLLEYGCDRAPEPRPSPVASVSSASASASVAVVSSGGTIRPKRPAAGKHDRTVKVDGIERAYTVYVPKRYNHLEPVPVMVFLQGEDGPLDRSPAAKGLLGGLERGRILGVFVRPHGGGWRHDLCGDLGSGSQDDVGFLTAVLLELQRSLTIDRGHIYLVGHGSGAIMAQKAGAAFGARIAGVAAFGGSIGCTPDGGEPRALAKPSGPLDVVLVHGKQDARYPFAGGKPKGEKATFSWVPADRAVSYWSAADRCKAAPKRTELDDGTVVREDLNCSNGTKTVLRFALRDQDEAWPSTIAGVPTLKVLMDAFALTPSPKR